MTDFIYDISNIPADYTIYVSFLLGLIVKFLWIWNIEYHCIDSINDSYDTSSPASHSLQQMKYYVIVNPFLTRITRCIRKKESPGDDPEGLNSILLT